MKHRVTVKRERQRRRTSTINAWESVGGSSEHSGVPHESPKPKVRGISLWQKAANRRPRLQAREIVHWFVGADSKTCT